MNIENKRIHNNLTNEVRLPEVISGMAMLQVDNVIKSSDTCLPISTENVNEILIQKENDDLPSSSTSTRVLRKRSVKKAVTIDTKEILNRRFNQRPRKRSHAEVQSDEDIKDYYLDKRIKKMPNNLETIFEEDGSNENSVRIGKKKIKRLIQFTSEPSNSKIRKQNAKIKLLKNPCRLRKLKKISMDTLIEKLNSNHSEFLNDETSIS